MAGDLCYTRRKLILHAFASSACVWLRVKGPGSQSFTADVGKAAGKHTGCSRRFGQEEVCKTGVFQMRAGNSLPGGSDSISRR